MFVGSLSRDLAERVVVEGDLDAVRGKRPLVLPNDRPLAVLENLEEIAGVQRLADNADREPTDEFRL